MRDGGAWVPVFTKGAPRSIRGISTNLERIAMICGHVECRKPVYYDEKDYVKIVTEEKTSFYHGKCFSILFQPKGGDQSPSVTVTTPQPT